jgi:hypothetical protein
MDRCTVGEAAGCAAERHGVSGAGASAYRPRSDIANRLPKKAFPGYPFTNDDAVTKRDRAIFQSQ